jgi:hypothetical protein
MDPNSKKCPFCRLINPASAQVCDCGYKFTGSVPDPHQLKAFYEEQVRIMIPAGASSLALGLGLTLALSAAVKWTGIYAVFYGLIISGVILLAREIHAKHRVKKLGL